MSNQASSQSSQTLTEEVFNFCKRMEDPSQQATPVTVGEFQGYRKAVRDVIGSDGTNDPMGHGENTIMGRIARLEKQVTDPIVQAINEFTDAIVKAIKGEEPAPAVDPESPPVFQDLKKQFRPRFDASKVRIVEDHFTGKEPSLVLTYKGRDIRVDALDFLFEPNPNRTYRFERSGDNILVHTEERK